MVNDMYTVEEFARIKGMAHGSVCWGIKKGRIKAMRVVSHGGGPGFYYLIPPGEVTRFKKSTVGRKKKAEKRPTPSMPQPVRGFDYKAFAEALRNLRQTADALPREGALADLIDLLSVAVAEWAEMHFVVK